MEPLELLVINFLSTSELKKCQGKCLIFICNINHNPRTNLLALLQDIIYIFLFLSFSWSFTRRSGNVD